jgi:hypothetical protein
MNLQEFAIAYRLRKPREDECGDMNIIGKRGDIYENGDGLLLATILHARTTHYWNRYREEAKRRGLAITQNGDREGTFRFDPAIPEQAAFAIEAVRAPRKKQLSPEHREKLAAALYRARAFSRKTQSGPPEDAGAG